MALERPGLRLERLLELTGQETRGRAQLEQLAAARERKAVGEPKRARVLRCRLAVGAQRGGELGRGRGVAQHGLGVRGGLCVVRQPRWIRAPGRWLRQHAESPLVQTDPSGRLDRVLDREPGELVAEGDARQPPP